MEHEATYTFRFPTPADAEAVFSSLEVERDDQIPNVHADWHRDEAVLEVVLRSSDLGDLRAATKSFFTRIQAAARVLEEASARHEK